MTDSKLRIAIIDQNKCKPNKCNKKCKYSCPVNVIGKQCITVEKTAIINESMCTGCGICPNVCPFNAIKIYNLPTEMKEHLVFSYGENHFKLYKMIIPKINTIHGVIGENGVGKSTMINLISNKFYSGSLMLLNKYKGTELYKYLNKLYDNKLIIKTKPQNIDSLQKFYRKKYQNKIVMEELNRIYDENNLFHKKVFEQLELNFFVNNTIANLSGGEMQKIACAIVLMSNADVYIFDEFTNYLDIEQRLVVSGLIQELKKMPNKYIFVIDHDLSILDYTCDIISIIYGKPGAYGIISKPYPCQEAINMFFSGYIYQENIRFRDQPFSFRSDLELESENAIVVQDKDLRYNDTTIEYSNLKINIIGSEISSNGVYICLGKNGTGKTTFFNHIAQKLIVSYKKQYVSFEDKDLNLKVIDYLYKKIKRSMCDPLFLYNVKSFIENLYDKKIKNLSGGEAQKVSLVECLGTDADIYLLDEPSANLDIEQRYIATKIIKRFLLQNKKTGFIVEHDIMMAIAFNNDIYNSQIIFVEKINEMSVVNKPCDYVTGINHFLQKMNITFRTEIKYKRPRINKADSQKDQEQKKLGKYYI